MLISCAKAAPDNWFRETFYEVKYRCKVLRAFYCFSYPTPRKRIWELKAGRVLVIGAIKAPGLLSRYNGLSPRKRSSQIFVDYNYLIVAAVLESYIPSCTSKYVDHSKDKTILYTLETRDSYCHKKVLGAKYREKQPLLFMMAPFDLQKTCFDIVIDLGAFQRTM